jgi:hypothetical protein
VHEKVHENEKPGLVSTLAFSLPQFLLNSIGLFNLESFPIHFGFRHFGHFELWAISFLYYSVVKSLEFTRQVWIWKGNL